MKRITVEALTEVRRLHDLWLADKPGGKRANLTDADLAHAILARAKLARANLTGANLTDANLRDADLTDAILARAKLARAKLTDANLMHAHLTDANLTDADLTGAKLEGANLSGATGLLNASDWLHGAFERYANERGYLVYKAFGDTDFGADQNTRWPEAQRRPGYVLTETVNPQRTAPCGSGVNFGTLEWIRANYVGKRIDIWTCLLADRDLADCVVPYNARGKARCGRLTLIELVES